MRTIVLFRRSLWIACVFSAVFGCCYYLPSAQGLPYNVRELFSEGRFSSALGVSVGLVCGACSPWIMTRVFTRSKRAIVSSAVLTVVLTTTIFFSLRLAVPGESIDDIVGSPVTNYGRLPEHLFRFVGLSAGVLWSSAAGVMVLDLTRRGTRVSAFAALVAIFFWLVLSYTVVVAWAGTNNIVELLRDRGKSVAVAGIPLCLALTSATACVSVGYQSMRLRVWKRFALLLLSCPVAWLLVVMAAAPQIEKYGDSFSALQFLLSTDRSTYLPTPQLAFRFVVLHYATIVFWSLGWTLVGQSNLKESDLTGHRSQAIGTG